MRLFPSRPIPVGRFASPAPRRIPAGASEHGMRAASTTVGGDFYFGHGLFGEKRIKTPPIFPRICVNSGADHHRIIIAGNFANTREHIIDVHGTIMSILSLHCLRICIAIVKCVFEILCFHFISPHIALADLLRTDRLHIQYILHGA